MRKQEEEKKPYNSEAIRKFMGWLIEDRKIEGAESDWQFKMMPQITPEKLEEAIQALPADDAASVEEFFNLRGESQKRGHKKLSKRELKELKEKTVEAVRKLAQIKYLMIYDYSRVMYLISKIAEKIDKGNINMSDVECVQYLLAFVTIIQNGPKLAIEKSPQLVYRAIDRNYINEYKALLEVYSLLKEQPGKPIKMQIIKSAFEALRFKDLEEVKEKFGIPSSEETGMEIFFKDFEKMDPKDQEVLRRHYPIQNSKKMPGNALFDYGQIRDFKERVFTRGRWLVTTRLATGAELQVDDFMQEMDKIIREPNWPTKLEDYLSGEKETIVVSSGIKTFNLYEIGGLKFSDPEEIDLIYLALKHGYA